MGRWGKIVVALVVVLAIIGAALVIMNKRATRDGANVVQPTSEVSESDTDDTTNTPDTTVESADVTITYNGQDFTLSAPSVKSGGTVKIDNTSQQTIRLQSNPHPIHNDNSEFNVGEIAAGQSVTITLTNKGTWGFHDHLGGASGEIKVE